MLSLYRKRCETCTNPIAVSCHHMIRLIIPISVTACSRPLCQQTHSVPSKNGTPGRENACGTKADLKNAFVNQNVKCPWPTKTATDDARNYHLSLCNQAQRCPLPVTAYGYSPSTSALSEPEQNSRAMEQFPPQLSHTAALVCVANIGVIYRSPTTGNHYFGSTKKFVSYASVFNW